MKKALLSIAVVAIAAVALPSCQKNYDCVCTFNGQEVYRGSLGKQSRADAKAACDAKAIGNGVVWKCEID